MQINTCFRCDRPWCYRGTGRATRCGVCKSPYWDRPRTLSAEGSSLTAGVRFEGKEFPATLSGDILHHRGLGATVHRVGNSVTEKTERSRKGAKMDAGSLGKMDGVEMDRTSPFAVGGKEADSSVTAKPQHSEQVKQALRDICAGSGIKSELSESLSAGLVEQFEIPLCGKTWWEDGEQYECLMDKGHREGLVGKHGLRGMVRRLDA